MPINEATYDEVISINSIFGETTLQLVDDNSQIFSLQLPSLPSVKLRVQFSSNYPETPPSILGTETVGQDCTKGTGNQVVSIVERILPQVYRPGQVCIYDLLEETREAIAQKTELGDDHTSEKDRFRSTDTEYDAESSSGQPLDLDHIPEWTLLPAVTEKKSVFLARAAVVSSPAQARKNIAHLLATDKKAARADHNMTAWRIKGNCGETYQDCDDDGETAAGSRMLHLMQLMDVWNVMVVVTRWYGGVLLGPDRFRIINTVAREVLILGGFAKGSRDGEIKSSRRK